MPIYIKELIVVLGLSIPLFALAKPTALLFMDEADFKLRRNVWLLLTTTAFLSPSFWLFAAVAAPTFYWGGRKDSNPLAFYLLLMMLIPAVAFPIPTIGINSLFSLDNFRLLSLCVLLPTALHIRRSRDPEHTHGMKVTDTALLGLGALQALLFVRPYMPNHVILPNSLTNDLRTAFLFVIDAYLLYYVASRSCTDRRKLRDALASYCLSCSLMAIIALFEAAKHWLLYTSIESRWAGNILMSEYYTRGSLLRAEASAGNPLGLAFLLVIGFGFWLYLQSRVRRTTVKITVTTLLCAALLVTFSRGPWFAALLVYLAYAGLSPGGLSRFFKAATAILLVCAMLLASPFGAKISSMVPALGGSVGNSSLTYRERLVDRSWELIKARPLFGDQLALSKMQSLVQGQGIIDVVNAYVGVTLFYGFTGLAFFLTFILSAFSRVYRATKSIANADHDSALLGANLGAAIVAILFLLADGSLGSGPECLFYVLIGLAGAYASFTSARTIARPGQRYVSSTADGAYLGSRSN